MQTDVVADAQPPAKIDLLDDRRGKLRLHPGVAVLLALLAAGIVFGIYSAAFPLYNVPPNLLRMFPSDEDAAKREVAKNFARTVHATVALALLGGLLALFLGGGEAVARRRFGSSVALLASGVIIAALLSALGGFLGSSLIARLELIEKLGSMERTVMGQLVMFGLVGLGVGFCLGAVANNRRMLFACIGAGLTVGILAGILFPIICAFAMPRIQTDVVIPDGSGGVFGVQNRPTGHIGLAMWLAMTSVLLALLIAPLSNRHKEPKSTAASA